MWILAAACGARQRLGFVLVARCGGCERGKTWWSRASSSSGQILLDPAPRRRRPAQGGGTRHCSDWIFIDPDTRGVLLSCGFLVLLACPRMKLVEEIQIRGNPLVGPGRPRRRRCSRAPFFFLETSVYVCSSTSYLTASWVKTLTPVGGGGVLDVVTFLKASP
ncbi:hypothetical protein D1007_00626 [Hordeum vulgare]|nr:hypothetical protein D1007_00626 [Hordeum vulgare]